MFKDLEATAWGTGLIVRILLIVAHHSVELGLFERSGRDVQDAKTNSSAEAKAVICPWTKLLKDYVLNKDHDLSQTIVEDKLGKKWWKAGPAKIEARNGPRNKYKDDKALLARLTKEDEERARLVVKFTNYSYAGLPRVLRDALDEC